MIVSVLAVLLALLSPANGRAQTCVGDCDGDWKGSVAELVLGIEILRGRYALDECPSFDPNEDSQFTIDEMVTAVGMTLDGCPTRTGTFELNLFSNGLERTALVTVPDSVDLNVPVPLLLNFHGVIATSEIIQSVTGMPEKAEAEGFITAAPQGIGRSWNAGVCCGDAQAQNIDDVGFTRDLVAALKEEYRIDPDRIYATGFSNGGAMVFRLACEAADLFAALAPVGGSMAVAPCRPARPLPLLIINAVQDPLVPYGLATASFNLWRDYNDCSGEPVVSEPTKTATCETYLCKGGATTLCGVTGIGHVWPGGATNPGGLFRATDVVWDFFRESIVEGR